MLPKHFAHKYYNAPYAKIKRFNLYPKFSNLTDSQGQASTLETKTALLKKKKLQLVDRELAQTKYARAMFQSYFEANTRARLSLSKKSVIFEDLCGIRKKYNSLLVSNPYFKRKRYETTILRTFQAKIKMGHVNSKLANANIPPLAIFDIARLIRASSAKVHQGP